MLDLRRTALVAATFALLSLGSLACAPGPCSVWHSPVHGCIVTGITGPVAAGPAERGPRTGRACGYNVLQLFAWGDVRIRTAMDRSSIDEVSTIGYETFELIPIVGILTGYCTIVTGD